MNAPYLAAGLTTRPPEWSQPVVVDRALSLTQPWASLLVSGKKRIETRSWATQYRGWLAIHAAKTFPGHCVALCNKERFRSALADIGIFNPGDLPLGALLGVAWLGECLHTDDVTWDRESDEYAFGNFEPGRYAWCCDGALGLLRPMPAKGHLSIWKLASSGVGISDQDLGPTIWGLI